MGAGDGILFRVRINGSMSINPFLRVRSLARSPLVQSAEIYNSLEQLSCGVGDAVVGASRLTSFPEKER